MCKEYADKPETFINTVCLTLMSLVIMLYYKNWFMMCAGRFQNIREKNLLAKITSVHSMVSKD